MMVIWDFVAHHLTISHLTFMRPLCLNATDYYARATGADKIPELALQLTRYFDELIYFSVDRSQEISFPRMLTRLHQWSYICCLGMSIIHRCRDAMTTAHSMTGTVMKTRYCTSLYYLNRQEGSTAHNKFHTGRCTLHSPNNG